MNQDDLEKQLEWLIKSGERQENQAARAKLEKQLEAIHSVLRKNQVGSVEKCSAQCPVCGGGLPGQFGKCKHCQSDLEWVNDQPCQPKVAAERRIQIVREVRAHERELREQRKQESEKLAKLEEVRERKLRERLIIERLAESGDTGGCLFLLDEVRRLEEECDTIGNSTSYRARQNTFDVEQRVASRCSSCGRDRNEDETWYDVCPTCYCENPAKYAFRAIFLIVVSAALIIFLIGVLTSGLF